MHQLTAKLATAELQMQLAADARADAEAEVAALQASLLQQTAIAEAAQGQLAAAAITQQAHALLAPPVVAQTAVNGGAAVAAPVEPTSLCADLAYAVQRQLAACPLPAADPKAQRIQELRAALAAALADAGDAARGALPGSDALGQQRMQITAHGVSTPVGAALVEDPKIKRLHEVVGALMAAAAQMPTDASALGPNTADISAGSSGRNSGMQGVAKQQRIQELRAALSEALRERDELRQQLQAGPASANSTLVQAERQLQEAQQQLVAAQVGGSAISKLS